MPTVPRHKPNEMRAPKVKSVQLLCVAHPSEVGGWEAFCLDFDLAVQGKNFDDAKAHLHHAISTYIQDAMKEEESQRILLLNRRAPFFVRLSWALKLFITTIRDRRDHDDNVAVGFPVTCPA